MGRAVLSAMLLPVALGIYFIVKRQYAGALGIFIGGLVSIPLIVWLEGIRITPLVFNISVGGYFILAAVVLVYLRRRKRKQA